MPSNKAMGIIFANMHDNCVEELTSIRSMASLPFAGRYRLIDFGLSSLVNAGVSNVVIVAKENYHSLMDHLGTGRAYDLSRKIAGLTIYPPFSEAVDKREIYHGRIGALQSVMGHMQDSGEDYVIMFDCDHVCNLDYSDALERHISSGADITAVCAAQPCWGDVSRSRVVFTPDADGRVKSIAVNAPCEAGSLTGMNIFIVKKELLMSLVEEANQKMYAYFERDILAKNLDSLNIRCHVHTDYVRRISSLQSYYEASMSLLEQDNLAALFCAERPVFTKVRDEAPVRYGLGSKTNNNLVADGCVIDGDVKDSVLFRGVHVEKGAVVRSCILMQDSVVKKNADMRFVIADKDVTISEGKALAGQPEYPVFIKKSACV